MKKYPQMTISQQELFFLQQIQAKRPEYKNLPLNKIAKIEFQRALLERVANLVKTSGLAFRPYDLPVLAGNPLDFCI